MVYLIKLNTEGVRNLTGVTSNARNKGFNFLRTAGMKTMVNDVRPPLKVNIDNAALLPRKVLRGWI